MFAKTMSNPNFYMLRNLRAIALFTPLLVFAGSFIVPAKAQTVPPEPNSGAIAQTVECSSLIAAANQAVADVQSATQSGAGDVNGLLQIADIADQSVGRMQAISLTDPKLQGYRDRFVSMYSSTGQASRALVSAVQQDDVSAAQVAYEAIVNATSQEGPLVNEVNTYCGSAS
jgi:uncharacterized protein YycO